MSRGNTINAICSKIYIRARAIKIIAFGAGYILNRTRYILHFLWLDLCQKMYVSLFFLMRLYMMKFIIKGISILCMILLYQILHISEFASTFLCVKTLVSNVFIQLSSSYQIRFVMRFIIISCH